MLETLQTKGFRDMFGLALVLVRGFSKLPKLEKSNRKKLLAGYRFRNRIVLEH